MTEFQMSSNRPYLLRAVYEWISDNGLTPYLLVDARQSGVRVPAHAVKDGQVVLNVAMRAVAELEMGNEAVRFSARFNGVSQQVHVPVLAVLAIYAQENGQGMMFPPEAVAPAAAAETPEATGTSPEPDKPQRKGPQLRVVK
jgi:stringent starvation protein B